MPSRLLQTFILLALIASPIASANGIYKCMKDERVVFSQTVCPKEYRQHKIEFQLGITTEIDSDKVVLKEDPLKALLKKKTISKEKLIQLLDSEVYRLKQENSYFEILRASEIQKLDRNRYWHKKEKDDPDYIKDLKEINSRFDELMSNNRQVIIVLTDHKKKIIEESDAPTSLTQKEG
ncbi:MULTISPECIES: DUF4124 domain-containing protein [unclassified Shewanella]|uniref:DUF4124 domain-containing protein n=1 Tax=unclassified Shewanella TaxID=196818 RepID=UPI000C829604|nr:MULTISPECIES: DUF4124 domain-containing protein [unclassified Shewanella]MDO6618033.1 DUF4124 domain-containing protein [Shewanella sp. 6_MG-2023]MDO6640982.1 DUF4124 domain-containing protein [Shewanella sp. 5_MG-2023]PMH85356.1 hypothetical protein BCU57_14400 [Shewanella sp. 10N.286.48.B5]PMH97037.1 hypothetical protein BCU55_18790 [Shewanella sp. 10N.286.48.A6]